MLRYERDDLGVKLRVGKYSIPWTKENDCMSKSRKEKNNVCQSFSLFSLSAFQHFMAYEDWLQRHNTVS